MTPTGLASLPYRWAKASIRSIQRNTDARDCPKTGGAVNTHQLLQQGTGSGSQRWPPKTACKSELCELGSYRSTFLNLLAGSQLLGQETGCFGSGRKVLGFWVGMRLREPLGTTEAKAEIGSGRLGMEPDIFLTVPLGQCLTIACRAGRLRKRPSFCLFRS